MHDKHSTASTAKLRLILKPTEAIAPEAGPELQAALQAGVSIAAPEPKGKFRPVEFPDEVVADAIERVRELAAQNPQREAELCDNPPPPDAKAARLAELSAGIATDVRELFALGLIVKVELHADAAVATE